MIMRADSGTHIHTHAHTGIYVLYVHTCTCIHTGTLTHKYVLYTHTVCTLYLHICTQYTHKHPMGSSAIQDGDGVESNASNIL